MLICTYEVLGRKRENFSCTFKSCSKSRNLFSLPSSYSLASKLSCSWQGPSSSSSFPFASMHTPYPSLSCHTYISQCIDDQGGGGKKPTRGIISFLSYRGIFSFTHSMKLIQLLGSSRRGNLIRFNERFLVEVALTPHFLLVVSFRSLA